MAYICEICAEQFSKQWNLDRHVKHFHKLNFLCNLCGFQTDDKQTSITHKRKHTQQYFECQHCDRKLKCRGSLLRHVREQHEEKKFSCVHCMEYDMIVFNLPSVECILVECIVIHYGM